MRALSGSLSGHAYTVVPRLLARAGKKAPFAASMWRRSVLSDRGGEVVLSGLLSEQPGAGAQKGEPSASRCRIGPATTSTMFCRSAVGMDDAAGFSIGDTALPNLLIARSDLPKAARAVPSLEPSQIALFTFSGPFGGSK